MNRRLIRNRLAAQGKQERREHGQGDDNKTACCHFGLLINFTGCHEYVGVETFVNPSNARVRERPRVRCGYRLLMQRAYAGASVRRTIVSRAKNQKMSMMTPMATAVP